MANIEEKNIILRLNAETTKAKANIDKLSKSVDGLNVRTKEAEKNLKQTDKAIEEVAKDTKKATDEVEDFNKEIAQTGKQAQKGFQAVSKSADKAKKSVTGLEGVVQSASSTFAGLLAFEAAKSLASGLADITKQSIGLAISAEQTAVAFETFLGSASAANKILAELNQFSAVTPFEPEQVIKAGQSLLAFGVDVEDVIPSVQKIGDIAAGTGTDFNELAELFGKAKVQGRLFGEDINQLTGRGIPIIAEFAKQFGVAESEVKDLVTQGRIGFPELEQAFGSLTSEGGKFFDLMNKQSQTVGGRISTLTGNFNELLKSIGERLLPFVGQLVDAFNTLTINATKFVEVPLSAELEKQRVELSGLVLQITDTNLAEEDKLKLIGQLQQQYPDFLGNLEAESVTNEQLASRLKEVNEELINKIVLQRKTEELQNAADAAANARIARQEAEREANEKLAIVNEKLRLGLDFTNTTLEQRKQLVNDATQNVKIFTASTKDLGLQLTAEGIRIEAATNAINVANAAREEEIRTTNEVIKISSDRINLANELGISITQNTDNTEENTKAKDNNVTATENQIKAAQKLLDQQEKLQNRFARDVANEEAAAFQDFGKQINKDISDASKEREKIRKAALEEARKAESEFLADSADFDKQNRIDAEESVQEDFRIRQLAIENQILARKEANQEFKDLDIELLEAQLDAAEIGSLEAIKIEQQLVDARRELRDEEFNEQVERARKVIDITSQIASATVNIAKEAFQSRQDILDDQIAAQEDRVKSAVDIAKTGNAELLQAEEDRLSTLITQREQNARKLQQIAAIEVAANQAIAVSQGIVAVTRAFASPGGFVEGIAASVALAATLASSVIALNNAFAGVQAFAEGTSYVDGPGTSKSDSIPAMLSKGERVVPADINSKYFNALNEFQNGTPKADMMASMLDGNIPRVSRDRVASGGMNTRNMERHLEGINKRLDNLQMQVNLDKDGFSASLSKYRELKERSKKLIR